ncbi:MAG: heme ABC exporter ATP-binding protein CcmA [Dinoroseobacter sp.]|nr:heme ABC exporter ATP-binding protein CcmA [Dinoroseobacter sp.]
MELVVKNVACARGSLRVIEGVSFTLRAGEALVLRGPNGIGKTTLLRTIAGLQPALEGQIELPEDAVAYAGHADGLKGPLSVAQNLTFWASIYGTRGIERALEAFDMTALLDRQAQDLSAGQKRRLGLARMEVTGRPIWILDEPTVSLDAANTALFAAMVARHLDAGGIALMATHIELGLEAKVLDLTPFKARDDAPEPFLDGGFL